MRAPAFALAFAALLPSLVAGAAHATVVVVPTLEEMAVAADVIADVKVVDQRVVKDGGRIVTLTTVSVLDGMKGAKVGDSLVIFQLGGALEGHNAWIVGAQRFQKDERFVIFAARHPSGGPSSIVPYGIGFGVFDVKADVEGRDTLRVDEVVGDVVSLHKGDDGALHEKAPDQRHYDSLPAFKQTIKQALALKELPTLPTKQKLAPHVRGN